MWYCVIELIFSEFFIWDCSYRLFPVFVSFSIETSFKRIGLFWSCVWSIFETTERMLICVCFSLFWSLSHFFDWLTDWVKDSLQCSPLNNKHFTLIDLLEHLFGLCKSCLHIWNVLWLSLCLDWRTTSLSTTYSSHFTNPYPSREGIVHLLLCH